jgi:hypothetical protein
MLSVINRAYAQCDIAALSECGEIIVLASACLPIPWIRFIRAHKKLDRYHGFCAQEVVRQYAGLNA